MQESTNKHQFDQFDAVYDNVEIYVSFGRSKKARQSVIMTHKQSIKWGSE